MGLEKLKSDLEEEMEYEAKVHASRVITMSLSIAFGIVIAGVVLFAALIVVVPNLSAAGFSSKYLTMDQMKRLEEALKIIDKDYLYEYDTDVLVDGAIKGMVNALDNQYTYYEFEEEYQDSLNSGSNASYVGIGVHLTYDKDTQGIRVLGTMPNSPAENAGILAGDIILKVDDLVVNIDSYSTAVDAIKGEEGTDVTILVYRNGESKEYTITRGKITENNVVSEVKEGNIGYIRIFAFDTGVGEQFIEQYDKMMNENNIQGLVIDLRNNPGGYVSDALEILERLLPERKSILRLVDKNGKEHSYSCYKSDEVTIPVTIILNQNSASASEILASALRDENKAKIVGVKSYGKGVVQYVEEIKGHGAISIVSAQYFTPSNYVIQENGIEPDYEVVLSDDLKNNTYVKYEEDLQLQKAIEVLKNQM